MSFPSGTTFVINAMPSALFISPHLDDAVFSAGGLAGLLADRGWTTVLVTAFTRSVVPAHGFALACQLDKGLAAEMDYMALRRDEDRAAADLLGVTKVHWLDLLEAPHRGYESAGALFGALNGSDGVQLTLAAQMLDLAASIRPDLVLVPQGLGNHVDHQQVVSAATKAFRTDKIAFYRDTPYAIRQPDAAALGGVTQTAPETVVITAALDRKIAAAQAYTSQLGFQFGGPAPLALALRSFALQEGGGIPAERYMGTSITALAGLAA